MLALRLKFNPSSKSKVIKIFTDRMKKGLETDIEIIIMDEEEILKRLGELGIGYLYSEVECE